MDILNRKLVEAAFGIVKPMIEEFLKNQQPNASGLAVVVTTTAAIQGDLSEDDRYLFSYSFGDHNVWRAPFDEIATSKASLSARTGKNSADLPPHYRELGDTVYWGSVVLDDIVVACSGIKPYYDEMISMWLATTIKALAKARFDEILEKNRDFIE